MTRFLKSVTLVVDVFGVVVLELLGDLESVPIDVDEPEIGDAVPEESFFFDDLFPSFDLEIESCYGVISVDWQNQESQDPTMRCLRPFIMLFGMNQLHTGQLASEIAHVC